MGIEKSRKGKGVGSFERHKGSKAAGKRYLIVCEGSKTEPNYFKELRHDLRLKSATIEICGEECGSDPVSVYKYAAKVVDENTGAKYDGIYCIVDKDNHKNLDEALDLIEAHGNDFFAVLSYPCFEYWLLLHFKLHRNSFIRTAKKSIGAMVLSELKKHDATYEKGTNGTWRRYKDKLPTAIANSKEIKKIADRSGNPNPSSSVHELVELLSAMV